VAFFAGLNFSCHFRFDPVASDAPAPLEPGINSEDSSLNFTHLAPLVSARSEIKARSTLSRSFSGNSSFQEVLKSEILINCEGASAPRRFRPTQRTSRSGSIDVRPSLVVVNEWKMASNNPGFRSSSPSFKLRTASLSSWAVRSTAFARAFSSIECHVPIFRPAVGFQHSLVAWSSKADCSRKAASHSASLKGMLANNWTLFTSCLFPVVERPLESVGSSWRIYVEAFVVGAGSVCREDSSVDIPISSGAAIDP
jgi:hypothetical protein